MVYIFKTSVTTKTAIKKLAPGLGKLPFVIKWNFDLKDCDNILRIEATELDIAKIDELLNSYGYTCIELF